MRNLLVLGVACLLSACAEAPADVEVPQPRENESTIEQAYTTYPYWGYLSSHSIQVPVRGTYFFPGDGYPGEPLYTSAPIDQRNMQWESGGTAARDYVVGTMLDAHLNVITMSYWGDDARWAPMVWTREACDHVFDAVTNRNLWIIPSIEVSAAAHWGFDDVIENRIIEVVNRYYAHPANSSWRSNWARVYDRYGTPRLAVQLLGIGSDRYFSDSAFIASMDALAADIKLKTGIQEDIGFMIDTGPGAGYRPDPSHTRFADSQSALAMSAFASEIWNPDFRPQSAYPYCDNNGLGNSACKVAYRDEIARIKRKRMVDWANTGMPVILDVNTGYDGRYVWGGWQQDSNGNGLTCGSLGGTCPGGQTCGPDNHCHGNNAVWGDNASYYDDYYRNYQSEMKFGVRNVGITINSWNGYTEGMVAIPSYRVPTAGLPVSDGPLFDNVKYNWLKDLYAADPRACNHVHYVNGGATKLGVWGAICEKWNALGATVIPNAPPSLVWGDPTTSEIDTPGHTSNATGGRMNRFRHPGSDSAIYWSGPTAAHELHALIYQKYLSIGEDGGYLGLPTTDELPSTAWCPNGRYNAFQHGWIDFCPNVGAWAHSAPGQGFPGRDH